MFAVPGWSVSSDALRAEKAPTASNGASSSPSAATSSKAQSKKRKRGGAAHDNVTASNVAELFESVVEGKGPRPEPRDHSSKHPKKSAKDDGASGKASKHGKKGQAPPVKDHEPKTSPGTKGEGKEHGAKESNKKQKKKKQKGTPDSDAADGPEKPASKQTGNAAAKAAPPPPAPPKLTPLQASMRQKLISARFRHLNETLYTRPSEEAYTLFQDSPEMFDEYHEGFRRQVKVWPENPVDSFLADIRRRAKAKPPPRKKGHGQGGDGGRKAAAGPVALPRTAGTCTIADLGCGDARLAQSLQSDKDKLRLRVLSYDLQSPHPLVTKADIANLPLEDGSVNVAIFCLALMGTNWVDFVEEAYRILHWRGELWVAEIKSRFAPTRGKDSAVVDHSVGRRTKKGGKPSGGGADGDDVPFEEDLAVEVDGADDRRRQTDVSAFVEVLRRRGFVLSGERSESVDLSNKMFVKMHFTKAAEPTRGKGRKEQQQDDGPRGPKRGKGGNGAPVRWGQDDQDGDDDDDDGREAAILKPCVYKIR